VERKKDYSLRIGSKSFEKIRFENREVKVFLLLYTDDVNKLPEGYRKYWFDVSQIDKIFNPIEK